MMLLKKPKSTLKILTKQKRGLVGKAIRDGFTKMSLNIIPLVKEIQLALTLLQINTKKLLKVTQFQTGQYLTMAGKN